MSKGPKPGARLVTITMRRDELEAFATIINRPGVKTALGMRPEAPGADGAGPGTTGQPVRRAINIITAAESVAKCDDARLAQEALREKEEKAQKAKRAKEERKAQRLASRQGNG